MQRLGEEPRCGGGRSHLDRRNLCGEGGGGQRETGVGGGEKEAGGGDARLVEEER